MSGITIQSGGQEGVRLSVAKTTAGLTSTERKIARAKNIISIRSLTNKHLATRTHSLNNTFGSDSSCSESVNPNFNLASPQHLHWRAYPPNSAFGPCTTSPSPNHTLFSAING